MPVQRLSTSWRAPGPKSPRTGRTLHQVLGWRQRGWGQQPTGPLRADVIPWQVGGSRQLERVALSVHMQTGSAFYYLTDHTWTPTSLVFGAFLGLRQPDDTFASFEAEGETWRW
ncbi:hypothetical protein [Streptomyces sp. NPDC001970]